MTDEIALFIDFENIRYSMINVLRREPDPQELIAVARRFGIPRVARAYADWTRQPDFFKGSLTAAMIDRVDCPAKVRERFRQYAAPLGGTQTTLAERLAPRDEHHAEDHVPDDKLPTTKDLWDEQTEGPEPAVPDNEPETVDDVPVSANGVHESDLAHIHPFTSNGNGPGSNHLITQSTVDLNMIIDIFETAIDHPTISTFVLMSGDRDFTRICARLKLRMNKRVIIAGIPGTVSRDLITAAEQFIVLGGSGVAATNGHGRLQQPGLSPFSAPVLGPVEPNEPLFIQFLDYIDRHWSWRTVAGVSNFIGNEFNPKNRFRGRLTRDSARELLHTCIEEGIILVTVDPVGGEDLRLNREHPAVSLCLAEVAQH